MIAPPERISGGFTIKKLWDWLNRFRDYVISITPRQGHGTRVHRSALGSMVSAQPGDTTIEGGEGKFKYRGMWVLGEEYKENDVVIIRAGQTTEGNQNYNHGTFFCVLDHEATEENRPKEPTFNQGETALDPLESIGPDDIWRTLAQGNWNDFVVAPFPGELPDGLIPFNYARMFPGNVQVASGTESAGALGSLSGGVATGSGGGTTWTLDVTDLPAASVAKFRLVTLCIGGEKFTAYVLMTAPEAVP
jgi:hypothetical protein